MCNNFAQNSREGEESRAVLFLDEPKPEKRDTRTLRELWADVRWERKAPSVLMYIYQKLKNNCKHGQDVPCKLIDMLICFITNEYEDCV